MNFETEEQFKIFMQKVLSGVETIALRKIPVTPHAAVITNTSGTIPTNIKSFNIINLGLNGERKTLSDIPVTGIVGLTAIPSSISVFGFSIENDQNHIVGPIVVTPATDHVVVIQYLK